MTARSFADTNVVVYTLDADSNKRQAAISVMQAHPVISVQVINEFLSVAIGKMKLPRTTANRLAQILMKRCEVFDLTVEIVRHAINLGECHQLSYWDALGCTDRCIRSPCGLRHTLFRRFAGRAGVRGSVESQQPVFN